MMRYKVIQIETDQQSRTNINSPSAMSVVRLGFPSRKTCGWATRCPGTMIIKIADASIQLGLTRQSEAYPVSKVLALVHTLGLNMNVLSRSIKYVVSG